MNYTLYLDESGNTGNPKFKNGKWNWGNQPYFALGSICIPQDSVEKISKDLLGMFQTFDKNLGTKKELKSTADYWFKERLTMEVIKILQEYNALIYVDISNKKYKLVMYVVEHCIYPYYLFKDPMSIRDKKVSMATLLYNNLSDDLISDFIELCQSINSKSATELIQYLESLNDFMKDREINKQIEAVTDFIWNYAKEGLSLCELFPIVDKTNKGSDMCFLPNLDALLNIIASTSNLRLGKNDRLLIYHDDQKQFSQSFIKWLSILKNKILLENLEKMEFLTSDDNVLIQTVDFITGLSLQTFQKLTNLKYMGRKDKESISILKPILGYCNIVSPKYEQEKFYRNCGFKPIKTPVPIDLFF